MNERILARRYAAALTGIASEKGILDRVVLEVELLADIMMPDRGEVSVPELLTFLGAPRIPMKEKVRLTDVMLEKMQFCEEVGNLLNVLIRRNRIALVGHIADQLRRTVDDERGTVLATVESAKPFDPQDADALRAILEEILSESVEVRARTEPALLGGLRVRIGDRLIDGSVEGALIKMENRLRR